MFTINALLAVSRRYTCLAACGWLLVLSGAVTPMAAVEVINPKPWASADACVDSSNAASGCASAVNSISQPDQKQAVVRRCDQPTESNMDIKL